MDAYTEGSAGAAARGPVRLACCVAFIVLAAGLGAQTQAADPATTVQTTTTEETDCPDTVLPWIAGPALGDTLRAVSLPEVLWSPAARATGRDLLSVAPQPVATFTQASAITVELAALVASPVQLVFPLPAMEANAPQATQSKPQAEAPKTLSETPKISAETPKAVAVAPKNPAPVIVPPVPAKKPEATSRPVSKASSPSAAKDPVPSPASVHNKELSAKSKNVPRINPEPVQIQSAALGEPFLVPAPEQATIQLPAQFSTSSKTVAGVQGSVIDIEMTGRGWIFTGAGSEAGVAGFVDKRAGTDGDIFRFRLAKTGLARLGFTRQDLASGLSEQLSVSLVSTPKEGSDTATAAGTPVQSNHADKPALQTRAKAPVQTVKIAPDAQSLPESIPVVLTPPMDPAKMDFAQKMDYAKLLARGGKSGDALALYQTMLAQAVSGQDEILFRMASLYQDDASVRDITKAYGLFVQIQKEYPHSKLALQAKEQARYIKRTFQID